MRLLFSMEMWKLVKLGKIKHVEILMVTSHNRREQKCNFWL